MVEVRKRLPSVCRLSPNLGLTNFFQLLLHRLPSITNYRIPNAEMVGQICIDFCIDYLVTQLYNASATSIFISDATQNRSAF